MTRYPKPRPRDSAVREPIQVYLATPDRKLLDRVAEKAGISRAEVLRRGIRRVAAEVLADEDPMDAFMERMRRDDWPEDEPTNVAERHDAYLAGAYTYPQARRKSAARRRSAKAKKRRK
jgi:hypothetical protein